MEIRTLVLALTPNIFKRLSITILVIPRDALNHEYCIGNL